MQNIVKYKLKKPKLEQILPEGLVVNREWLYKQGYERYSIDYFLRSKRLQQIDRGLYRRPGPPLKWQHLIYSFQIMGKKLHVGGKSALDIQGFAHYLKQNIKQEKITLYGEDKIPTRFSNKFIIYKEKCFKTIPKEALTVLPFGHWDWELKISTVELALLEIIREIKNESDFIVVDRYFESVTVLNPNRINKLLKICSHIKTKRLFMWFAKRHHHPWFNNLKIDKINLGKGKREIIKGGILDKTYQITIPREMAKDVSYFF